MPDMIDIDDLFGVHTALPERDPQKPRGPSWGDRERLARAERNALIAAMYRRGDYLDDIAEAAGLRNGGSVSNIIQGQIAHWRKMGLKSIAEKQAEHLRELDLLEQELMEAWQQSKSGRLVKVSEKVKQAVHNMHRKNRRNGKSGHMSDPDGGPGQIGQIAKMKKYRRNESSPGDPRYMALILDIRKERAKIWGLYAKADGATGPGQYDPNELAKLDKTQIMARFMVLIEQMKMERARKLAAGVEIDITPRAILMDAKRIAAKSESSGPEDEEF